jgi:ABC-type uncharacterized transport system ATPase subunit
MDENVIKDDYVIEMEHISKSFPGIKANNDITIRLKKGEIHALLGENGAGKSTLMSILFGLYQPDEGEIKVNGNKVLINNPNDANALGIGMVHQHFKLVDVFSVLDNIILGAEPMKKKIFIDKKKAADKLKDLSNKYGLNVDLNAKIEDITVGMQQRTEILKMLYRDNDILIFDEPTAVLTPQEIDELLEIMRGLAKEGKSILFISHKLDEIMKVSDTVTILRKGKLVKTVSTKETNKEELSSLMVGRNVSFSINKKEAKPGDVVLEVHNLSLIDKIHKNKNAVDNVSFNVRKGEIVCIAGIDGNGQSELIYGITGLEKVSEGHIFFNGKDITNESIFNRLHQGMSHIPEDRHRYGLVLDYRLDENLVLENYWMKEYNHNGFLKKKAITKFSEELIEKYDVRSGKNSATIVRSMSGGNQQKAIVGREIERCGDLLIAVQPTRGLDVGAIEYIHKKIVAKRDDNRAILVVSLELDEVMDLADRILVMFEGKIVGELDPKKTTVEEVGLYMSGTKHDYKFEKGDEENGKD